MQTTPSTTENADKQPMWTFRHSHGCLPCTAVIDCVVCMFHIGNVESWHRSFNVLAAELSLQFAGRAFFRCGVCLQHGLKWQLKFPLFVLLRAACHAAVMTNSLTCQLATRLMTPPFYFLASKKSHVHYTPIFATRCFLLLLLRASLRGVWRLDTSTWCPCACAARCYDASGE